MRYRQVLLGVLLPALSAAQEPARRETVLVRESRSIPREVAEDVTRVFNAPGTLRVGGTQTVGASGGVSGDVAILEGRLTIAGRVTGRVVAINADVIVESAGRVDGDVTILGGRLTTRDASAVGGDVRTYGDRVELERDVDRVIVHDEPGDELWFRRRERWRNRGWSELRLVSARTYNRVEGLPILLGPTFGRDVGWGRVTADVLGIIRSADNFEWKSANVGHSVKAEISIGKAGGVRLGGRLFDLVDPVEPWHLSDSEVGLASFFLHRDYRDYFDRHGASVYGALFLGSSTDLTVSYGLQRWGSREARTPFTLFRGGQDWRPNPRLDDGRFHLLNTTWRYDTRNDEDDPWSGWYVVTEHEYGWGHIDHAGPASSLARINAGGRTVYSRVFLDLRRYNRVTPDGQLNLRVVLGGWLDGNELPLQRRLSVGGHGTLPGYDFRRVEDETDYWQCSAPTDALGAPPPPRYPPGVPAQCERIALAQLEYRGEIRIDPFGILDEERDQRRRGWGRGAEWVVFADAGRGWLVGSRTGRLQYPSNVVPHLGTFRSDVGVGLRLDDLGLYVAKSISDMDRPLNFFIRLRPRF